MVAGAVPRRLHAASASPGLLGGGTARVGAGLLLGLILGDFTTGYAWAVAGWALKIPYFSFQQ